MHRIHLLGSSCTAKTLVIAAALSVVPALGVSTEASASSEHQPASQHYAVDVYRSSASRRAIMVDNGPDAYCVPLSPGWNSVTLGYRDDADVWPVIDCEHTLRVDVHHVEGGQHWHLTAQGFWRAQ